jgi:hypothetical protein
MHDALALLQKGWNNQVRIIHAGRVSASGRPCRSELGVYLLKKLEGVARVKPIFPQVEKHQLLPGA